MSTDKDVKVNTDKDVKVSVAPGALTGGDSSVRIIVDNGKKRPDQRPPRIVSYRYRLFDWHIDNIKICMESIIHAMFKFGMSRTLPYGYSTASTRTPPNPTEFDFHHHLTNVPQHECMIGGIRVSIHQTSYEMWFHVHTDARDTAEATMKTLLTEIRAQQELRFPIKVNEFDMYQFDTMRDDYGKYGWAHPRIVSGKPLSTLYMDGKVIDRIMKSIKHFLANRDKYERCGVLWKHVTMLWGLSGVGKTSLIRAIAFELKRNIYYLNIDCNMTSENFSHLIKKVTENSIIAIEDVDALFDGRKATYKVSFSDVINALDGFGSTPGSLWMMTTNAPPEHFDFAERRPGRIDNYIEIPLPVRDDFMAALKVLAPEFAHEHDMVADRLATMKECTIAHLQKHIFTAIAMERASLLDHWGELMATSIRKTE